MNKKKGAAAIIAGLIALLTVIAGMLAEADAAYAQYGQADLAPYLENMQSPASLPPEVVAQLNEGVPAGNYGNIQTTINPFANPFDMYGILETGEYPVNLTVEVDPPPPAAPADNAHTYIIVERPSSMSADPNLIMGLQSQVTTATLTIAAIIGGAVIGGTVTLALRGQSVMAGLASRIKGSSAEE